MAKGLKISKEIRNWIILGLVLIILCIGGCAGLKEYQKMSETIDMYGQIGDTLKMERNEKGELSATIQALSASNSDQLLSLNSKDSTIILLQNAVRSSRGRVMSASVMGTTTSATGGSETIVDTVFVEIGDTIQALVYTASGGDEWWSWEAESRYDSTIVTASFVDTFAMAQSKVNPWFKKSYVEAEVKSLNPYTDLDYYQTFIVDSDDPRWSLGLQATYGYVLDDQPRREVMLGVGVNYRLLKIK